MRQTTFKGSPLDLEGPELKVGQKAPDARLRKSLVDELPLGQTAGQVRLISVVPSLDTPVCAAQTRRFNQEASKTGTVQFITISCDLPTAQARFCGAEGIDTDHLLVLSDYYDCDFGKRWGTLIPKLRVESRALFVVDADDTLRHVEYVKEVTEHPNYDAALLVLQSLTK